MSTQLHGYIKQAPNHNRTTPPYEQRKLIHCAFYRRKMDEIKKESLFQYCRDVLEDLVSDGMFNPFAHVEFVVADDEQDGTFLSYGITQNDEIIHCCANKRFENPKYETPTVYSFCVNQLDYIRGMEWIDKCIRNKEGFDSKFHYSWIPIVGRCLVQSKEREASRLYKTWYCSKLTAMILYKMGILDESVRGRELTPQELFWLVKPLGTEYRIDNIRPIY